MAGRAGRGGLDETGYLLVSKDTPRLSEARQFHLHRSSPLPWSSILSSLAMMDANSVSTKILEFGQKLFSQKAFNTGIETTSRETSPLPCNPCCDTSRAHLIRRKHRAFKLCRKYSKRNEYRKLNPSATPVWEWISCGILAKQLKLTERGHYVSGFLGPEGLAIAAIIEDKKYPLEDAILDLADLFGVERFCEEEPRWSGRLTYSCRKIYRRLSIEGWLEWGIPYHYGYGSSQNTSPAN